MSIENSENSENIILVGQDAKPPGWCWLCPNVRYKKLDENAVTPTKGTEYSIGYDLTVIGISEKSSKYPDNTILYRTGLAIQPPRGYYTVIVPRSSISKTGHFMANCIGIIDEDYRGELLIAVTKHSPQMPDLEPPFRKFQLLLRRAEYYNMVEVPELDGTQRGDGGFGSTGE